MTSMDPGGRPVIRPFGSGGAAGSATGGAPRAGLDGALQPEATPKIRAFEQRLGAGLNNECQWKRPPSVTGTGAVHVKSFHCKLATESLGYLDQQINEWLDAHPECEVKFVTTAVGEWTGKIREPNLIVQVWV